MTQIYALPLPTDLPTFQTALSDLERVPDILYRGLEYGAFKTSSFREAEFPKRKLDACLSASVFRAHAIDFFKREGLDAQPDGFQWTFNNLPFLGISFYYNQLHVRILKGPDALLPGCGRSRKKKKFYDQLQSSYLVGTTPMRSKANLIVLWDFNSDYALAQLWLALPAKGGQRPKDVSAFWCNPLDHPAEKSGTPVPPTSVPSDDGMDQLIRTKTEAAEDKAKGQSGAR
jgi:hypothetical protein